uniref:sensor histidine kinase n=1 Tax=Salmonella enterica TaxID=28901 RepID=UPI00352523CC
PAGGNVVVSVEAADGRAVISVTDDGRGLSEDERRQVFERFYRADPDDHTGGTGVGLTIARSIARAHGGDLQVRSDGRGCGATFLLTLPA